MPQEFVLAERTPLSEQPVIQSCKNANATTATNSSFLFEEPQPTELLIHPTTARNIQVRTISLDKCIDDDDDEFSDKNEEAKFERRRAKQSAKEGKRSKPKRLYDPNLELSFYDFCILMGFDVLNLITEETPSFLLEPEQPEK